MWKRYILSQANTISKKIMTFILMNIITQAVVLTLFRPEKSSVKKWVTSKSFKLKVRPPNLGDFSLKLSGNILKSSWRVHQYLRYLGSKFWQPFFLQFAFFLQKRIYFHFYLLNNSITVNLVISYQIYHNYFNTRFTLYLGIFHFEGKNWCNLDSVKKIKQYDVNMSIKVMALRCWKK